LVAIILFNLASKEAWSNLPSSGKAK
jgi:hypothetical protein